MHEQSVIGTFTNNANLDAIVWVPPCETVHAVKPFTRVQVINRSLTINGEGPLVTGYLLYPTKRPFPTREV